MWPAKLVMVYKGYELTAAAADFLSVPRYGAGSLVAHRAVFAWFAPSHNALIALHTLASVAAIALLCAGLASLLRGWRRGGDAVVVAAFALALLPQLIHDARSESIGNLGLFAVAVAWVFFARWLEPLARRRRAMDLAVATLAATLAATIRPELLVVAPALLAGHLFARWPAVTLGGGFAGASVAPALLARALFAAALFAAALLALALLVPHLLHMQRSTAEQIATGGLPPFSVQLPLRAIAVVAGGSALFRPLIFPTLWLLLAVGIWVAPPVPRRAGLMLLALALGATGLVAIDLPDVSLPRLHAASAALAVLALSVGVFGVFATLGRLRHVVAAVLVLAVLPTGWALAQPTDEDAEERLIDELAAALPPQPVCIARVGDADVPHNSRVHRHFPDYLFLPPRRHDRLLNMADAADSRATRGCGEVWLVMGTRCWLRPRATSPRVGELDVCAQASAAAMAAGAAEVHKRVVDNRRSDGFGWSPDDAVLELRLLRLSIDDVAGGR